MLMMILHFFFFFQAEDGIRDLTVTGVQTCALPICVPAGSGRVQEAEAALPARAALRAAEPRVRSEEHTSELQSQSNLVCRLLLEKKKKKHKHIEHRVASISEHVAPLLDSLE